MYQESLRLDKQSGGIAGLTFLCLIWMGLWIFFIYSSVVYFGMGFRYIEEGQCYIVNSTIQETVSSAAPMQGGDSMLYRVYFCVNFFGDSENITRAAAVHHINNAGWATQKSISINEYERYLPEQTYNCAKGDRVSDCDYNDTGITKDLIVIDETADSIRAWSWGLLIMGLLIAFAQLVASIWFVRYLNKSPSDTGSMRAQYEQL